MPTPRDTLNRALEECKGFTEGERSVHQGIGLSQGHQVRIGSQVLVAAYSLPNARLDALAPSLLSALTESVAENERLRKAIKLALGDVATRVAMKILQAALSGESEVGA